MMVVNTLTLASSRRLVMAASGEEVRRRGGGEVRVLVTNGHQHHQGGREGVAYWSTFRGEYRGY